MNCIARPVILIALSTASLFLSVTSQASHTTSDLYTNLFLLDPEKQSRTADAYILVQDRRIVAVGTGTPVVESKVRVHDMHGRFALPGFIDAHAHITLGPQIIAVRDGMPSITFRSDDAISQRYGRIALAYGVTTVRNPGGETAANAKYEEMVASGQWIGPDALSAGAIVEPPPFDPPYFVYPRTEDEWQTEAAHQAKLGMRYFKLYSELSEEEVATGIRVAHQHGLKAIAHLNKVSWTRAAQLGIDGLEHALATSPDLLEPAERATYLGELGPTSKYMYRWYELANYKGPRIQEMIRLIVEKKVALNMTLVVNEIVYNADDPSRAYPAEFRRYEDPSTLDSAIKGLRLSSTGWTPDDFGRARSIMPKVLRFARMLYEAGAPMMIGTDGHGGSWFYAREMQLHVQAGIPPWAVLRMATSQAADILGIGNHTGRIAPGFDADIVFLDRDPVADIGAVGSVYSVMSKGKYFLSKQLLQKLEVATSVEHE
ncbi:MAG TPA: amidohydrolase family protein [Steroidobacteraceae bacterium]|nr:amidohydrolase family protein [Steroidobacteraceae bacterium]